MFRTNDGDAGHVVSRHEARIPIERAANLDDIDIDIARDGRINWAELTRCVDASFR